MTTPADDLLQATRIGCYCERFRKPCVYHEGMLDGLDLLEQAGFYVGRCNHVTTDEGTGYCPQAEALARRAEQAEAEVERLQRQHRNRYQSTVYERTAWRCEIEHPKGRLAELQAERDALQTRYTELREAAEKYVADETAAWREVVVADLSDVIDRHKGAE